MKIALIKNLNVISHQYDSDLEIAKKIKLIHSTSLILKPETSYFIKFFRPYKSILSQPRHLQQYRRYAGRFNNRWDFTEQQKPSEDTVKALSVSFSKMDDIEFNDLYK
jgi:hypothetical protein